MFGSGIGTRWAWLPGGSEGRARVKSCQVLMLSRELFVVAVGQLVGDVMVF